MRTIIIGVVCVAIGIVADALFLPHQSLWNDEATQLDGLTLSPIEVTRWLAGRVDYDFGVPDDRMPPLSYWAGWVWSRVFGLHEWSLRWFSVACVAIATAIVFATASRAWGLTAGVAASLLLATSPNVIGAAVEIRAYSLFMLHSAGLFACLVGYAASPAATRRRWLVGIVAFGIAAMYTHFFGLVALGGALLAALILTRAEGQSIIPVLVAGTVAAVAALGLAPFVMASTAMTRSAPPGTGEGKLVGLVRLAYRQFSGPAMSVSSVAVGLAAVGFVLGVACGLAPKRRWGSASTALGVALASGGLVVALVHLVQSSIAAASPTYNVWTLPTLAILIASGLDARARAVRATATLAIVLLMASNVFATSQLALRGDYFAHTAYRPISELIRHLGPREVAVVHDGQSPKAWAIYAPTRYEFGGVVRQYIYVPGGGEGDGIRVADYPSTKVESDPIRLAVRPSHRGSFQGE